MNQPTNKYTATQAASHVMEKRGYVVIAFPATSGAPIPAGMEFSEFGGHKLNNCKLVVTHKTRYKDLAKQMKVLNMPCPPESANARYFRCNLVQHPPVHVEIDRRFPPKPSGNEFDYDRDAFDDVPF